MSWQSYVDDQLLSTKMIKHAVICGHDGNIWASSADFKVTPEELKVLISKYGDTDKLAQSGVTIAGTRYMFLSNTDRVVRAKKGTNGVHAIKTQQTFIVCLYEDPVVPEQAATVTEKLGDYLIQVGF
jgi:profilin